MQKLEAWLEEIDCEGELTAIPSNGKKKFYRLKSSMHSGIVLDASAQKESLNPFIEIEHRLYEAGVKVAKIFTYNREEGFLFMEDLGDTHLYDIIGIDFELFYGQALDSIMKMQNADTQELPLLDEKYLKEEMQSIRKYYLEEKLEESNEKELERLFNLIIKEIMAQPHELFVHSKFYAKNIMFGCSDNIVLIDFQDAKVGAITYDLVSLLRDVYVEFHPRDVERLALNFRDKIGLEADDETFMRWFDFTGLQRHLMLLGKHAKEQKIEEIPLIKKHISSVASKYEELESLNEILGLASSK